MTGTSTAPQPEALAVLRALRRQVSPDELAEFVRRLDADHDPNDLGPW